MCFFGGTWQRKRKFLHRFTTNQCISHCNFQCISTISNVKYSCNIITFISPLSGNMVHFFLTWIFVGEPTNRICKMCLEYTVKNLHWYSAHNYDQIMIYNIAWLIIFVFLTMDYAVGSDTCNEFKNFSTISDKHLWNASLIWMSLY